MVKKRNSIYLSLIATVLLLSVFFLNLNLSQADTSGRGTWAPYTSKDVMVGQWKALCDAHPEVASYESIGHTVQGRDIWLFKIGNPAGARVMYDGECHGPEDGGTETLFKFCRWLLESGDPFANHILEYNYHLIIPILNMDSTARQNMRREYVLNDGTPIPVTYGVDLNRNGLWDWNGPYCGSSNPADPYSYRGLYAGSEPETMAYHNAVAEYLPLIYVNTHIGSEFMVTYSNTAFEQEIKSLMAQYKQQYGVTYSYPIQYYSSGCGVIPADADNNFGASGWLWEICTWEHLKPTLSEWLDVYYPRVFPVFLAFAKAAENKRVAQPTTALIESCNSTGDQKNAFDLGESIFVVGSGYASSSTYNLNLVDDLSTWSDGLTIPARVPGTISTIQSNSEGAVPVTTVWSNPQVVGKYDIVIDADGDGVYDAEDDLLVDNAVEVTAGTVIPEFSSFLVLPLLILVTFFAVWIRKYGRK